jgi:hypothetical protein
MFSLSPCLHREFCLQADIVHSCSQTLVMQALLEVYLIWAHDWILLLTLPMLSPTYISMLVSLLLFD